MCNIEIHRMTKKILDYYASSEYNSYIVLKRPKGHIYETIRELRKKLAIEHKRNAAARIRRIDAATAKLRKATNIRVA